MKVSDEYFNQLNPSYQTAIIELEKKLDELEKEFLDTHVDNDDKILKILLEFSSNYLMPKEYWPDAILCAFDQDYMTECAYKADYHFYFDIKRDNFVQTDADPLNFRKTIRFMFGSDFSDSDSGYNYYIPKNIDLSFPHSHLQQIFNKIERKSNYALPKHLIEQYERSKTFFNELKEVEGDVEKWFTLLCEIGYKISDEDFIWHNVEYRLGTNLLDTKLWMLYIEYLRENDPKEMLQVYSKYCRFFLDDSDMKEKYKQEVEKYGPIYVPWKNLFDFELEELDEVESETEESEDDKDESDNSDTECPSAPKRLRFCNHDEEKNDHKESAEDGTNSRLSSGSILPLKIQNKNSERNDNIESSDSSSHSIDLPSLCKNFYKVYQRQNFPFKNSFLTYVLGNANHKVLKKLHHSCKYFYVRKQTPICLRLSTNFKKSKFCKESLKLGNENDIELFLKDTIVSTTFAVYSTNNLPSLIISKLYRCEAKYIDIGCYLSTDELKFLLQSGNVIFFKWLDWSGNHKLTKAEEITQYLPKIEEFHVSCVKVTSQTFQIMLTQTFTSKIFWFNLNKIYGEDFDTNDLINFCIKNRAEYFNLYLNFSDTFPNRENMDDELSEKLKNYQKTTKHTKFMINNRSTYF